MIVYKITNLVNGKAYVGQTVRSIERRFKEHCEHSNKNRLLSNAIRKYDKKNFKIEVLSVANSRNELDAKEHEYIIKFNTLSPNGYNLKDGGNSSTYSETARKNMSKAKDGYIPWNKGLNKSLDSRVGKQGSSGSNNPNFGKQGHWAGKKMPPDFGKKVSESKSGRKFTVTDKYLASMKEVGIKNSIRILCHQNNKIYVSFAEAQQDLGLYSGAISHFFRKKMNNVKGFTFEMVL